MIRMVAVLLLVVGVGAGVARGDDRPAANPKEVKRWISAGELLLKRGEQSQRRGKAEEAAQLFTEAIQAFERAGTEGAGAIAQGRAAAAEAQMGRHDRAVVRLRRAVQAAETADLQAELSDQLEAAVQHVALVTIAIEPAGSSIVVDGEVSSSSELALIPGEHRVEISAPGRLGKKLMITAEAGSEIERSVALEPAPVVSSTTISEETVPPEHPPLSSGEASMVRTVGDDAAGSPSRRWLYVGTAASVALVAGAALSGWAAVRKHNTFTDPVSTPEQRADAQSSGRTLARTSDVLLLSAAVAAGATAYYYVTSYRPRARRATSPSARATPLFTGDFAGMAFSGSF
jgi:hypothetical protein